MNDCAAWALHPKPSRKAREQVQSIATIHRSWATRDTSHVNEMFVYHAMNDYYANRSEPATPSAPSSASKLPAAAAAVEPLIPKPYTTHHEEAPLVNPLIPEAVLNCYLK